MKIVQPFRIPRHSPPDAFPDAGLALVRPQGLLAVGGDLGPQRLLNAYRRGIFPWFSEGQPILWWSPDPRAVLWPDALRVSRTLRRTLRRGTFRITVDTAFDRVVRGCAAPRAGQDGTWITRGMAAAYGRLHRAGHAHSIECWAGRRDGEYRGGERRGDGRRDGERRDGGCRDGERRDGGCRDGERRGDGCRDDAELAGGLYGVAIGRVFFGESMFSRADDASKVALAYLCTLGFELIDCQIPNLHLARLGAVEMDRRRFLALLDELCEAPGPYDAAGAGNAGAGNAGAGNAGAGNAGAGNARAGIAGAGNVGAGNARTGITGAGNAGAGNAGAGNAGTGNAASECSGSEWSTAS